MTDRELLELAAKAAGYRLDGLASRYIAQGVGPDDLLRINEQGGHSVWNPLTDDGDALRLAVVLKLDVVFGFAACQVNVSRYDWAEESSDVEIAEDGRACPYAATRRAIVRAAAAIWASKELK